MTAVVNVCFHGIGTPRRDLEPGEAGYWVDVDIFHRILDEVALDPRVQVSFDDGNASDVEVALPALRQREMRATFFVLAGRLDQRGSLSSEGLRQLAASGMEIGSHGMDHRPWRHLSDADAARELVDARDHIADVAGVAVRAAALPLGRYDRRTLQRLRATDYGSVSTSDRRWGRAGAWLQPRYSIRAGDTVHSLRESVLRRPPLARRARTAAVGAAKRWR